MFYVKWYFIIALIMIVFNTGCTLRNYKNGKFPQSWELWAGGIFGVIWIIAIPMFIVDWLAMRDIIPLYDRK